MSPRRKSSHINYSLLPDIAFVRLEDVITVTGLRRTSIYDLASKNRFPKPEKLTEHAAGYRWGEVKKWLTDPQNYRGVE